MENGTNKSIGVQPQINLHLVKDELVNTLDYSHNVREDAQAILTSLGEDLIPPALKDTCEQDTQTLPERMSNLNNEINTQLGEIRGLLSRLRQLVG